MGTRELASQILLDSANLRQKMARDEKTLKFVDDTSNELVKAVSANRTIFACGNGGSACDAMHLTEELIARYKRDRRGIKSIHFCDPGALTCWGNDKSFETAFARSAETLCEQGDILVAISTSGRSPNMLAVTEAAQKKGTKVIALTGKDGGTLAKIADFSMVVDSQETERIQEVHITIIHIWCEVLDRFVLGLPIG